MPEAHILYTVTGLVVVGLVAWVAVVLKTAGEPWARPLPAGAASAAAESRRDRATSEASTEEDAEKSDPPAGEAVATKGDEGSSKGDDADKGDDAAKDDDAGKGDDAAKDDDAAKA